MDPGAKPSPDLLYFLAYEGKQPWHEHTNNYVLQLRLCLKSILAHTPPESLPRVLFLCDASRQAQIRQIPEVRGFDSMFFVFETTGNMCVDMCSRYMIFDALAELDPAGNLGIERMAYCDADSIFFGDASRLFDGAREGFVCVKEERKFDPKNAHPYFMLQGEEPAPGVPFFNSGHFVFANGPFARAFFGDMTSSLPKLCARSSFLDQPVFNCFARARHRLAGPCLDLDFLGPLVRLFEEDRDPDKLVLVHYVDWDKVPRMIKGLEESVRPKKKNDPGEPISEAPSEANSEANSEALGDLRDVSTLCILLEAAQDRVDHVRDVVSKRIPGIRVVKAIDGRDDAYLGALCSESFEPPFSVRDCPDLYTRCAVATRLSHMRAMRTFLDTPKKHGVIMEDDAVPGDDYESRMAEAVGSLPPDYDILYVFIDDYFRNIHGRASSPVVVPAYETYSLACYVVSRPGAAKILRLLETESPQTAVDVLLVSLIRRGQVRAYCASRKFVTNAGQPCKGSNVGMPSRIWNDR